MSERFEWVVDLGPSKSLEIYIDHDGDIGVQMDSGDETVQAWINHVKAREIAKALLDAANDVERAMIARAKESKQ